QVARRLCRSRGAPALRGVAPTQIVEAHLSLGQARQPARQILVSSEVAHQPVAQPPARHPAQLLLDALQTLPRTVRLDQLQQHRVQRREPSHRARHVHPLGALFPPVPFHVHQPPPPPRPCPVQPPSARPSAASSASLISVRYPPGTSIRSCRVRSSSSSTLTVRELCSVFAPPTLSTGTGATSRSASRSPHTIS